MHIIMYIQVSVFCVSFYVKNNMIESERQKKKSKCPTHPFILSLEVDSPA